VLNKIVFLLIPREFKSKYTEIIESERTGDHVQGEKRLVFLMRYLFLGFRLRLEHESFANWRTSLYVITLLFLSYLYIQVLISRDVVFLIVIWMTLQRLDFRERSTRNALKVTLVHLGVSLFSDVISIGLHLIGLHGGFWAREISGIASSIGNVLEFLSLLTAAVCLTFWVVDFLLTRNVLVSGKILSATLAVFFLMNSTIKVSNRLFLVGANAHDLHFWVELSKLQQTFTNLMIPILVGFLALSAARTIHNRRDFDKDS
jgi:hypothetical protein